MSHIYNAIIVPKITQLIYINQLQIQIYLFLAILHFKPDIITQAMHYFRGLTSY